MKLFPLLILVFNLTFPFAQENITFYTPSEIFNYSLKEIEINDSIKYETLLYQDILSPYNPITKLQKTYSKHRKYKLENGQIVSLDIYNDTTIVFNEFIKYQNKEWDSLISSGELKIKKNIYDLRKFNHTNQYGDDSIFVDTVFHLIQVGLWSKNIDLKSFEIGNYENGRKHGEWFTINSEYHLRHITPIIKKTLYNYDIIKNETVVDLSKNIFEIETHLKGEWFNIGLNMEDLAMCKTNKCSLFFVRDSSKFNRSFAQIFDYLNLEENNELLSLQSKQGNCKGDTPLQEKQLNEKWSINSDGNLILNGGAWKIEYLTENEMIISHE